MRQYPAHPLPAIGVVIWKGDETLVIRRGQPPGQGRWGLVGGVLEVGETHFEAAIREAREETGLVIQPFGIITAIDGITHDAQGRVQYHYSIVEVNARWTGGEPCAQSDILEARWMRLPDIRALGVWSEMMRVLELAEKDKRLEMRDEGVGVRD